jgi:predicted ABC-type ATPase
MLSDKTIDLTRDLFLRGRPAAATPTLYAMAGIPGAGKSRFVNNALQSGAFPADAFILDPDRVMNALPEYQDSVKQDGYEVAFMRFEMPARDLAYAMLQDAVDARMHIIKDMGCARRENFEKLQAIKKSGYRLEMFYIPCTIETALTRIANRARHTPEDMVRERAESLGTLLPDYQKIADRFTVVGDVV